MNKSRILLILIAMFAVGVSAVSADLRSGSHHDASNSVLHPCILHVHHGHDHAADHHALNEMHRFALHRFGQAKERPETFGTTGEWARDWQLRWADYEIGGHVVRLYHVTSKHDPQRRFLSVWDHQHGRYAEWQPAH